jgi:glutathione S-transferase
VTLKASLNIIESYFLKDKKFIGGDEISIADLQFLGEVTQYWIADCDIYKGRPNMERWMEACQKQLAPCFDSIFDTVLEVRAAGTYHYNIDTAV